MADLPVWAQLGRVVSLAVVGGLYVYLWCYATDCQRFFESKFSAWWIRIHIIVAGLAIVWWFAESWKV